MNFSKKLRKNDISRLFSENSNLYYSVWSNRIIRQIITITFQRHILYVSLGKWLQVWEMSVNSPDFLQSKTVTTKVEFEPHYCKRSNRVDFSYSVVIQFKDDYTFW